jgi:hypothetical protein
MERRLEPLFVSFTDWDWLCVPMSRTPKYIGAEEEKVATPVLSTVTAEDKSLASTISGM